MLTQICQAATLAEKAYGLFILFTQEDTSLYDDLLERLTFTGLNVSLWSYCCYADGNMSETEDELTDEMIYSFFLDDSIFSKEIVKVFHDNEFTLLDKPISEQAIAEYLITFFNNPAPIGEIVDLVSQNHDIAYNFYEQACLIFSIDDDFNEQEREFLNDLSEEFKLSKIDRKNIERKHLKHLEKINKIDQQINRQNLEQNSNSKGKKRTFWERLKRSFARLFSEIGQFFKGIFSDN
jgi:hypothetical protein